MGERSQLTLLSFPRNGQKNREEEKDTRIERGEPEKATGITQGKKKIEDTQFSFIGEVGAALSLKINV